MDAKAVSDRITAYLASGGLFNPELANHDAVRDLLMDARAQLDLLASVEGASDEIVRELPESCYETVEGLRVISPAKVLAHILAIRAELASVRAERGGLVDTIISVSGYQDVNGAILSCALSVRAAHPKDAT